MTARSSNRSNANRRRGHGRLAKRRLAAGAASLSLTATLWGLTAIGPDIAMATADDGSTVNSGSADGADASVGTGNPSSPARAGDQDATDDSTQPITALSNERGSDADPDENEDPYREELEKRTPLVQGAGGARSKDDDEARWNDAKSADDEEADVAPTPATAPTSHLSNDVSAGTVEQSRIDPDRQPAAQTSSPEAAKFSAPSDDPEAMRSDVETFTPSSSAVISLDPPSLGREIVARQIEALMGTGRTLISILPLPNEFKEWLFSSLNGTRRTLFNQAPWLNPTQISAEGGVPINGTLGAVDLEGDLIRYAIVTAPTSGTVALAEDGTFTYTPNAGFTGVDNFVVSATDIGEHINLFDLFRSASTSASLLVNERAVSFVFNYTSGSQYWTSEARNALYRAANKLMGEFIVTRPVILTYEITGENSTSSNNLASAESGLTASGAGFFPTVVQHKLLTGFDANGAAPDGQINWNFAYPWAFGDYVSTQQYDFDMVAMHEFMHSLGFMSYVQPSRTGSQRGWTLYDSYLRTASGAKLIGSDFRFDQSLADSLTGGRGGAFFGGASATSIYGALVPLYAPPTWIGGSSISHLDSALFTETNRQLMNPQVPTGQGVRTLSAVERAIMQDLGYTLAPLNASSALALVGVVFMRRRRVVAD